MTPTTTGLTAHRGGRVVEAEAAYRLALAEYAGDARAWHLLGMLLCQTKRGDEGIAALRRAVELEPKRQTVMGRVADGRVLAMDAGSGRLTVVPDDAAVSPGAAGRLGSGFARMASLLLAR